MEGTMKAVRLCACNKPPVIERIPIPQIGANDVLIKVKAAGINGGDIHVWRGEIPPGKLPMTMLHEISGVIEKIGDEVGERYLVKKGDRVTLDPGIYCNLPFCRECHSENQGYCEHTGYMGMRSFDYGEFGQKLWANYADGGFAEFIKAPAGNITPIADNIPWEVAANLPTVAVAYRALLRAGIKPGDTLILNAATGKTGIIHVRVAMFFAPSKIIITGRDEDRLKALKNYAPDKIETVSLVKDEVNKRIMGITGNRGVDCLVDMSPYGVGTLDCLKSLKKNGSACIISGGLFSKIELELGVFTVRGINITGSVAYPMPDLGIVAKLVSENKINLSNIPTKNIPLEEGGSIIDEFLQKKNGIFWVMGIAGNI